MTIDDVDKKLIQYAYSLPTLSVEEERALGERIRESEGRDTKAIDALVHSHLRYAISIARRFRSYGVPMRDLIQEGSCGLTIAAARFDPNHGSRFATYAQWWITAMMAEYVLKNWSLVKIGSTRAQKALFFNLRKMRNIHERQETSSGNLSEDTIAHIAESLNVSPAEVRNMEQRLLHGRDHSLNVPANDEDGEQREQHIPSDVPNPEEVIIHSRQAQRRTEIVNQAIATLPEREQIILRARLLSEEKVTLEDLGQQLKVSKERIRQLEVRATRHLNQWIQKNVPDIQDLLYDR